MFELLKAGGFLIWPILLCSVVALAIVLERFLALKSGDVAPPELIDRIRKLMKKGELSAKDINEIEENSPLGKVLAAGLRNPNQHRVVIKEAIEEAGRHVVHDLERHLTTLGTIANITPLLGLLGTVIGMIKVFSAITTFGVGDPQALAEGISEALVTTAAGLSVGIPSLMFYRFFKGKVNELTVDMEQQALKFMKILQKTS
ncbi:MAG: MotA/TolQ/ExbB proton channel family protein [Acidiferrobacterales bacterium]|nr:MotA/TolQ/ExbB proton channel family protein [Acidiferrobacterales bacterium]